MKYDHSGFNPEYGEEEPTREQISGLVDDTILAFGAPWCWHCKAAEPAVQEVLMGHPELRHIKIYDGKGKPLGRLFRVTLWPTLILLRSGKEVARLVRPTLANEIRRLVEKYE